MAASHLEADPLGRGRGEVIRNPRPRPDNADAAGFRGAAQRRRQRVEGHATAAGEPATAFQAASPEPPTSFANGRYTVTRFLGEGGKKKVYLARDSRLDRDVAFALIKTEGLDEASRVRVQREVEAT